MSYDPNDIGYDRDLDAYLNRDDDDKYVSSSFTHESRSRDKGDHGYVDPNPKGDLPRGPDCSGPGGSTGGTSGGAGGGASSISTKSS